MLQLFESQIRQQYKILSHEGSWTRVRCEDVNQKKQISETRINGVDDLIRWAREYHLQGNLFLGRNPVDERGKVSRITSFSVDIDPVRPKKTASTDEAHSRAIGVGRNILARYGGGCLCSSGNGALVLWVFDRPLEGDLHAAQSRCREIEKFIRDQYQTAEVEIDSTYDAARLVKLMGSVSTKGDRRYWRHARFLSNPAFLTKRPRIREAIMSVQTGLPVAVLQESGSSELGGGSDSGVDTHNSTNVPASDRLKLAEESIRRLSDARRDSYQDWLKVGIALKEFGDAGLRLWDRWSKASPKYMRGDCENKWATFRRDQLLTVGTLKYWADQDSPMLPGVPSARGLESKPEIWTPGSGLEILRQRTHVSATSTGFSELDRRLDGYRPGYVYAVEAPTNVGKSTFIVQAANELCRAGKRVLLVITEMDVREAVARFASTVTGLGTGHICTKYGDQQPASGLREFEEAFKNYPLAIHYTVSPNQSQIEQLINEYKPDALLWDYFQHFETGTDSRQQQLGSLARWYESMALKYQIPVIVTAQLHRRIDFKTGRYKPSTMDDIKDCKVLNDAAKVVVTLNWSQDEQTTEDGPVTVAVNIEKNKGPMGSFNLALVRSIPRFQEGL